EGPQEIAMRADTLWIDTGRAICTLTWRGYVESPTAGGVVVVATEAPGQPLPWAEVLAAARRPEAHAPQAPPRTSQTFPFVGSGPGGNPASGLPFATGMSSAPNPLRAEPTPPSTGPGEPRPGGLQGLPFARAPRTDSPVSTASDTAPPPGDAAPAW